MGRGRTQIAENNRRKLKTSKTCLGKTDLKKKMSNPKHTDTCTSCRFSSEILNVVSAFRSVQLYPPPITMTPKNIIIYRVRLSVTVH